MPKESLHDIAVSDLPHSVELPKTWQALITWALGKWGVGIVGFLFLVPVYSDLKQSNERFAKLSEANVTALIALTHRVEMQQGTITRMEEIVRKIETKYQP